MAEMAAHDLDVVVLGRAANVRYMTGAPPLWTAGTRAFGPSCVVIRSTGAIHMLSTWDEGVPEEIPHENLYGITWNPMNLVTVLKGIDGAAGPRRVGTDALTPRFAQLLPMAFPSAELVDCEPAMQAARRIKTTEEVAAIRAATGVAEDALAAAVGELRAGVTERELTGIFMDAMASRGVTTPARQDVARITSRHGQRGRVGDERTRAGDLVAFSAGVVAGGYTAEVGRTWPVPENGSVGHADLYRRWDALWTRLLAACQPRASGTALITAYEAAGEPPPSMPSARGLGLGFDAPVVTGDLPKTAAAVRLEPGVVLAVTGCVSDERGSVVQQEIVRITPDGPELLSSSPFWHS
jgi:Xaa-Pro aminopeptidase